MPFFPTNKSSEKGKIIKKNEYILELSYRYFCAFFSKIRSCEECKKVNNKTIFTTFTSSLKGFFAIQSFFTPA